MSSFILKCGIGHARKCVNLLRTFDKKLCSDSFVNQSIRPKNFHEIPGPNSLPVFGTLFKYLPVIGEYSFNRLHRNGYKKFHKYGPIVRENIVGNVQLLLLFDPIDIETMYTLEGRFPMRRSHLALEKYRRDRPHMYSSGGLLPTNGEEWWRLRSVSQKVLSRPQCVRTHLPAVSQVGTEFSDMIHVLRDKATLQIPNFLELLRRVFLEMTVVSTLDIRLGSIGLNATTSPSPTALELIKAADASNKAILKTDNGLQFWRKFETPLYKQLIWGQDIIYKYAMKFIEHKKSKLTKGQNLSEFSHLTMLEFFLKQTDLGIKDIVTVVCDALLAGIDTGAYTMSYVLYHLATNTDKQEQLAKEITSLMNATRGEVTGDILLNAHYLKAVVKESNRMNPISIGVGRIATEGTVIGGYAVPKETVIVSQNQVSCRLEKYCPQPNMFLPERWMTKSNKIHPFLVLPFGHGPRACIGRRMAEQSLYVILAHLISRFHFGWKGGRLDNYSHLINEPDQPLLFTFHNRK